MVLDAALRLFVKGGYQGTSMGAIAEAAGVTKPVVYECYPGKAELFRALLEREERRLLEAVAAALPRDAAATEDMEGLAIGAFTALLRAAADAPDSWRVVFASEHGADPVIRRHFRRGRTMVVERLTAFVREILRARGTEADDRVAAALAELLTSLGEGGVRLLLDSGGDWKPEDLARLLGTLTAGALDRAVALPARS
jgi:AcrR family transcriptional regulator